MIASWMIYATVVTGLLAIVAALLERVFRANGKPARMIWLGAILTSLLLNANAIWRAQFAIAAPLPASQIVAPYSGEFQASGATETVTQTSTSSLLSARPTESWLTRTQSAVVAAVDERWLALGSSPLLRRLDSTMLFLWAFASALTIVLLAGSAVRLQRRRTTWRRTSVRGIPILVTDGIGPAVVGVVESEIAVPGWLFRLDPAQQQLIVEHERQHLLARDPVVMLGALIAAAIVPWNAAMWVMVRRLRRSTEMDCDQRVLVAFPTPRAYAALLVDIGSHSLPHASFGHALADPTSDLERRVDDILNGRKRISAPVVAFLLTISAALVIAACAAPAPRVEAEPAAEPAAAAAAASVAVASDSVAVARNTVAVARDTVSQLPARATVADTVATVSGGVATTKASPIAAHVTVEPKATNTAHIKAVPASVPPSHTATPLHAQVKGAPAVSALPAHAERPVPTDTRTLPVHPKTPLPVRTKALPARTDSAVQIRAKVAVPSSTGGAPHGIAAARPALSAGGRAAVAGTAQGGRGAGTPPGASAQTQGRGAPPVQARDIVIQGKVGVATALPGGAVMTPSSGEIKLEGATKSSRIPSMDSVAVLAARRYPQFFTESAKTDSLTIVLALDTLGQVMATASLPMPIQPNALPPRADLIFPDIPQMDIRYGEWRSGSISARGYPTKTMSLLFLVFGRKLPVGGLSPAAPLETQGRGSPPGARPTHVIVMGSRRPASTGFSMPTRDSLRTLAAKSFPQLFALTAPTDSVMIAFALDSLGQVANMAWTTNRRVLGNLPNLVRIFPGLPPQQSFTGMWLPEQPIAVPGYPTRYNISILAGRFVSR